MEKKLNREGFRPTPVVTIDVLPDRIVVEHLEDIHFATKSEFINDDFCCFLLAASLRVTSLPKGHELQVQAEKIMDFWNLKAENVMKYYNSLVDDLSIDKSKKR